MFHAAYFTTFCIFFLDCFSEVIKSEYWLWRMICRSAVWWKNSSKTTGRTVLCTCFSRCLGHFYDAGVLSGYYGCVVVGGRQLKDAQCHESGKAHAYSGVDLQLKIRKQSSSAPSWCKRLSGKAREYVRVWHRRKHLWNYIANQTIIIKNAVRLRLALS